MDQRLITHLISARAEEEQRRGEEQERKSRGEKEQGKRRDLGVGGPS